jgi:hypothetical protein
MMGKWKRLNGNFFVYSAFSIFFYRVYRFKTFLQISPAIIKPNPINQIFNSTQKAKNRHALKPNHPHHLGYNLSDADSLNDARLVMA